MSVFLAKKAPSPKDTPAVFLAKKLNGYTPAPISTLSILGITRYPEIAYGMYRNHIDAFCFATVKDKTTYTLAEAYGNIKLDNLTIPFVTPPLGFTPQVKLTTDQANSLLHKLGDSATMKIVGKTFDYTVRKPKFDDISKFLAIANPIVTPGSNRLSALGFATYTKVLSLLEAFLATNYYYILCICL